MSLAQDGSWDGQITAEKTTAKEAAPFKKKLGSSVQVNRYRVPIIYVKNLVVDGRECCGCYEMTTRTIFLDITREDVVATFFHELFHAELIEGGFRQNPKWCSDLEEIVVEILSRSIAHGFRLLPRK